MSKTTKLEDKLKRHIYFSQWISNVYEAHYKHTIETKNLVTDKQLNNLKLLKVGKQENSEHRYMKKTSRISEWPNGNWIHECTKW